MATFLVRVTALPSADVAVTTSCQLPADSSSGESNVPSVPTLTEVGPTVGPLRTGEAAGSAEAPGTCDAAGPAPDGATVATGVPSAFFVWTAFIETLAAFEAEPRTGMAPFSNRAPSAGEATASVGASITRNGTVMKTRSVFSDVLPVAVSSALTSNWFRPRRRSTSTDQRPASSAVTRYGSSRPASFTVTVALGIEVPRSVYEVVSPLTSITACGGFVSAIVGGFAKRTSWIPMYTANTAMSTVSSAATTITGEKVNPWRGAASGFGTARAGSAGTAVSPRSRRHWRMASSASSPR